MDKFNNNIKNDKTTGNKKNFIGKQALSDKGLSDSIICELGHELTLLYTIGI